MFQITLVVCVTGKRNKRNTLFQLKTHIFMFDHKEIREIIFEFDNWPKRTLWGGGGHLKTKLERMPSESNRRGLYRFFDVVMPPALPKRSPDVNRAEAVTGSSALYTFCF